MLTMKTITVLKCKAGTSNCMSFETGSLADLSQKYVGKVCKTVKTFRKELDKGVDRMEQDYYEVN